MYSSIVLQFSGDCKTVSCTAVRLLFVPQYASGRIKKKTEILTETSEERVSKVVGSSVSDTCHDRFLKAVQASTAAGMQPEKRL